MNAKTIAIGVIALAFIGFAALQLVGNKDQGKEIVQVTGTQQETIIPTAAQESSPDKYTNGEYTAEGQYTTPAGEEKIEITITLQDGIVTDSEFVSLGKHATTKKMQGLFAAEYKDEVVGKNIDEVDLDQVNGSSLTPNGFENALEKIKLEAKAS